MNNDAPGGRRIESALKLPPQDEARCRAYSRLRRSVNLAESIVPILLLAAISLGGFGSALAAYTAAPGLPDWLCRLLFVLLVGVIIRLSLLPLQFAGGHLVDRRFGVSRQSSRSWLWEWLCFSTISGLGVLLLLAPLVEGQAGGPWMITALALPWAFMFTAGRDWFDDQIQRRIHARFYPVSFLRWETFPVPGVGRLTLPVFLIATEPKLRTANAFLRFRRGKPAIYVTDTLIREFTDGEERVVMAHEFGHLYDRLHLEERTRKGIAQARRKAFCAGAQLAAGILSVFAVELGARLFGLPGASDLAAFPLLAGLTLAIAHLLSPWLCRESRRDEHDADEYALAVTGDAENYLNVMRKLRLINLEELQHPFWSRLLLETHPSYLERGRRAGRSHRRVGAPEQRRRRVHWRGWRHIQSHGRR